MNATKRAGLKGLAVVGGVSVTLIGTLLTVSPANATSNTEKSSSAVTATVAKSTASAKKVSKKRAKIHSTVIRRDRNAIVFKMKIRNGKSVYFKYRSSGMAMTDKFLATSSLSAVFPGDVKNFRVYVTGRKGFKASGWKKFSAPPMPVKKPDNVSNPEDPAAGNTDENTDDGIVIEERKPDSTPPDEFVAKVIADLNAAREQGAVCGGDKYDPMQTLKPNAALSSAAQEHAYEMYNERWFSEVSPSGDWPMHRALSHGFRWTTESWENNNYPSAIVGLWLSPNEVPMLFNGTSGSPSAWWGTCLTLLDPDYNSVGVGVAGDWNNYTRWVTIYVGKEG